MKLSGFLIVFAALSACAFGAPPETLHLWPRGAPGETAPVGAEHDSAKPTDTLVGGRTVSKITGVSDPSITIYRPEQPAPSHAAVLVFPGGAYRILAMDIEGTEVCEWLNSLGLTCAVVKYRVPNREGRPRYAAALEDAQRAIALVRQHAKDWEINPDRVGVLGFSAGGHLTAALSNNYEKPSYSPVDAADSFKLRPDFAVVVYPGYIRQGDARQIAPELKVTSQTPPTIVIQAADDPVHVMNAIAYFEALHDAGVPATLHVYSKGGHGYGLRDTGAPVNRWPQDVEAWFRTDIGILPPK